MGGLEENHDLKTGALILRKHPKSPETFAHRYKTNFNSSGFTEEFKIIGAILLEQLYLMQLTFDFDFIRYSPLVNLVIHLVCPSGPISQ